MSPGSVTHEIDVAIDDLDDLIDSSPAVPLTSAVRIDAEVVREAVGRLRPQATVLLGTMPERAGPTADVFTVIDEIEASVATARRIPLTEQLQIDKFRVSDLLSRLRLAVAKARASLLPAPHPRAIATLAAIDAVDDLVFEAKRPLFSYVRTLDETALRDASARLRRAVDEWTGRAGEREPPVIDMFSALDELDELMRTAKRAWRSGGLRLDPEAIYDLLDRLRFGVNQVSQR
jgi:hypothetical protein